MDYHDSPGIVPSGTLVLVDSAPDAGKGFIAWKIATIPYGSEGEEPRNVQECPYFLETGNETSCVSGSGGSMCGGFIGGVRGYVYCIWGLHSVSRDSS